jgi:hypothetical protein
MLWWIASSLLAAWFVVYVILQRRGWVHLLLLSGLSFLFVQVMAYRKTRYQRKVSEKS